MGNVSSWFSKGTSLNDWKKSNLNYTWYWILAVFFGFFALDQLYLGSPKTFIMKYFLNLVMLGYPWFYEALMASTAQPQVKFTGSPNPVSINFQVGGGRFADEPTAVGDKHANAFLYAVVLMVLGIVGGDSFLMGNYLSGFFRLLCTLTVFLIPISFIWWVYKVFLYVFATDSVYEQDYEFFGYPAPAGNPCSPGVLKQLTSWIAGIIVAITSPIPFIGPLAATMVAALNAFWGFSTTLFGFIVKEGRAIATTGSTIVQNVGDIGGDGKSVEIGGPRKLEQDANRATAAAAPQTGGGLPVLDTSSALGALLTGTIGFILVSSIVLSWRRTYQNTNASKQSTTATATATTDQRPSEGDDVPPEPRGPRETPQGA